MKILWHSTKPNIPTGYGTQSNIMIGALAEAGYDIDVACTAGLFSVTEVIQKAGKRIRLFPHSNMPQKYGMDVIEHHFKQTKSDVIWSFIDCFIFDPVVCKKFPWIAWVPVDSEPLMIRNVEPLKACRWILSPTKWGVGMIEERGLECEYLPCSYSEEQYCYQDQKTAKELLSNILKIDLKEKRLINVVSANTGMRKNFPAIFQAWAMLQQDHKDILLYIHSDPTGYFSSGEDLNLMMDLYGVDKSRVLFAPAWEYICGSLGSDFLELVYGASEFHLNTCYGEGFGLPVLEAQACGCPCVVPDFGGAKELVKDGMGIRVPGRKYNTVPGSKQLLVDEVAVADAMFQFLSGQFRVDREVVAESVANYEINHTMQNYTILFLEKVEDELHRTT